MKTTAEILEALNGIFRHVLKNESLNLPATPTAHAVAGWASLPTMLLISEVEKAFGVRFNFREIVKMKNVGDLCAAIANKMKS